MLGVTPSGIALAAPTRRGFPRTQSCRVSDDRKLEGGLEKILQREPRGAPRSRTRQLRHAVPAAGVGCAVCDSIRPHRDVRGTRAPRRRTECGSRRCQSCAANAIALAIPCHRMVRNDATISGYAWNASAHCSRVRPKHEPVFQMVSASSGVRSVEMRVSQFDWETLATAGLRRLRKNQPREEAGVDDEIAELRIERSARLGGDGLVGRAASRRKRHLGRHDRPRKVQEATRDLDFRAEEILTRRDRFCSP
jgi:6-O-methylguanine DNA methyltransferase, DNA binding domain